MSLREKQIASLKRMLNLNEDTDHNDEDDPGSALQGGASSTATNSEIVWKVLVFDELGMQVISSVLRVNDLRGLVCHSPCPALFLALLVYYIQQTCLNFSPK